MNYFLHIAVFIAGVIALRVAIKGNHPTIEIIVVGTIFSIIAGWLTFRLTDYPPVGDFLQAYYPAGKAVMKGPRELVVLFEKGVRGFVNFPIVAWLFAPFSVLGQKTASLVFTYLGLATTVAGWWLLVHAAHLDRNSAVMLLFLFSANGPLHYSLMYENISHVLLLPITGAFLLLRNKSDFFAGVLLGMAAILKPPLLLFGLYFSLRGRWRVVMGSVSVVTTIMAASLAFFGWDMHVVWFDNCILPFSSNTIPTFNVQTLHAFLGRLIYGASHLGDFIPQPLSFSFRILAALGVLTLFAAAFAASLRRHPSTVVGVRCISPQILFEIEFFMVLVLAIVGSPLSWSHYYVWLLVPTAFVIGRTEHFPDDAVTRWLAWSAILLVTLPVIHLRIPDRELADLIARSLVSYLFAGGILMLAMLVRSRWKAASLVA